MNQGMKEKADKFEKEKVLLSEEKRELVSQVEALNAQLEESKKIQQQQEEGLKEMKNHKELLSQVRISLSLSLCLFVSLYLSYTLNNLTLRSTTIL